MKLTTLQDTFDIPLTLRRCDAALVVQEDTLAPMLRDFVFLLQLRGRPKRTMDASRRADEGLVKEEFLFDLASIQKEDTTATEVTREVTRAANHRVDGSRFKFTPAITRSATRQARQSHEVPQARPQQKTEKPQTPTLTSESTSTEVSPPLRHNHPPRHWRQSGDNLN